MDGKALQNATQQKKKKEKKKGSREIQVPTSTWKVEVPAAREQVWGGVCGQGWILGVAGGPGGYRVSWTCTGDLRERRGESRQTRTAQRWQLWPAGYSGNR